MAKLQTSPHFPSSLVYFTPYYQWILWLARAPCILSPHCDSHKPPKPAKAQHRDNMHMQSAHERLSY